MRNGFAFILSILDYLGALFWVFGLLLLTPLIVYGLYQAVEEVSPPAQNRYFFSGWLSAGAWAPPGGMKVMRIAVLLKMVGRQIRRVVYSRSALNPVVADGEIIEPEKSAGSPLCSLRGLRFWPLAAELRLSFRFTAPWNRRPGCSPPWGTSGLAIYR